MNKREFEELVYVKSSFFRNRLELVSHRKAIIDANGEVVVTLRSLADVALLARLRRGDTGDSASSLTIDEVGARYDIRVPVLQPGGYILRVFAKRRTEQGPYAWALDYKIEARPGITQVSDQPPRRDRPRSGHGGGAGRGSACTESASLYRLKDQLTIGKSGPPGSGKPQPDSPHFSKEGRGRPASPDNHGWIDFS